MRIFFDGLFGVVTVCGAVCRQQREDERVISVGNKTGSFIKKRR